jgi:hypothetical protein
MEVPGGDWIAQFVDPQGASFAVHVLKADLAPAEAESTAAVPQQGTLDFPPADSAGPERVSVAAQKPLAKKSLKQTVEPTRTQKPAENVAAKQAASTRKPKPQQASRKKAVAANKPSAKKSSKKSIKRPAAKKKHAVVKAGKKSVRKTAVKKAKKSVRPAARKKSVKKARRSK